jgi:4-hydroxybenzoate polyprenyltransferase
MYIQFLRSLNRLHPRAWDFVQLARLDRPIGVYLLLWPTLWAGPPSGPCGSPPTATPA